VSVRRCPDCGCGGGGGGDDLCCACPAACAIFVRGDEGIDLPVPFSSTFADVGSQEVGCCNIAAPTGGDTCPISPLVGAGADGISGVIEAVGPGFGTGCGSSGAQNTFEDALVSDCFSSSVKTGPRDFDFRTLSGYGTDERNCPQVVVPSNPGAIIQWDPNGGPTVVTAWGGSRIVRGPLVMVHQQRFFWADPGGGGTGAAFWVFIGLGGGVSVIASTVPRCDGVPCVGGETAPVTTQIPGGASASGSIDCDGAVSIVAAFNASVDIGCDIGPLGECFETGLWRADFEMAADLDFASIVHQCPDGLVAGNEGGVEDEDPVGGFYIPPAFLHNNPELTAAYERLREYAANEPGDGTQVPPLALGAGDFF